MVATRPSFFLLAIAIAVTKIIDSNAFSPARLHDYHHHHHHRTCSSSSVNGEGKSRRGRLHVVAKSSSSSISEDSSSSTNDRGESSRRSFFASVSAMGMTPAVILFSGGAHPDVASAVLPSVTSKEFDKILEDSSRSVQMVEFAGPRSEDVTVRLVDGTTFTISDVYESAADPRSPLQIAARCRLYKIPTKFDAMEDALSKVKSRRKKLYQNSIVQEAAVKQREKAARMQADEEARLAALYQMELDEDRETVSRRGGK